MLVLPPQVLIAILGVMVGGPILGFMRLALSFTIIQCRSRCTTVLFRRDRRSNRIEEHRARPLVQEQDRRIVRVGVHIKSMFRLGP
jgi:hypothetical protein